jgi:hypothetical protein
MESGAMAKPFEIEYRKSTSVIFLACMALYTVGVLATSLNFAYHNWEQREPAGIAAETPDAAIGTPPSSLTETVPGDLSLSVPLSSPSCGGQFVTFVGAAVIPGKQQAEVQRLLANYPGSSYLLTELSCSSLRARLADGRSIYAVYYGPFATQTEACAARTRAGGDSYVKRLDNVRPDNHIVEC